MSKLNIEGFNIELNAFSTKNMVRELKVRKGQLEANATNEENATMKAVFSAEAKMLDETVECIQRQIKEQEEKNRQEKIGATKLKLSESTIEVDMNKPSKDTGDTEQGLQKRVNAFLKGLSELTNETGIYLGIKPTFIHADGKKYNMAEIKYNHITGMYMLQARAEGDE